MIVINSTFFNFVSMSLLLIVLASCASYKSPSVRQIYKITDSKVFKIVSVDESGNEINDLAILEALQQNINTLSSYPGFYSAVDDLGENVSGFEVIIIENNNNIKVQYLNGKLSSSGNHKLTKAIAIFKIDIKKDNYGLYKTVTVHSPDTLNFKYAKTRFSTIKALDTPERLQSDVEQIFDKLKLTLERLQFVSGEIIVRNSDDEVFDNFEHKLGLYSKNSFQEKGMIFGIFELKSKSEKEIIPLRVRIFPDNRGSRVKYEFGLKYSINSDGTTTYDNQEINYLVTTIKNISTIKDLDAPINHVKVNNKNLIAIIDDPIIISQDNKVNTQLDIHKTTITYNTQKNTKAKPVEVPIKSTKTKKPSSFVKTKNIARNQENKQMTVSAKPTPQKSNNLKNIEYIEKMLSSLKEQRPSK